MTNYIWITTRFEGYHFYKDAPSQVQFLKNLHRHLFKIKVWIEIFHDDRELEFITVKWFLDSKIDEVGLDYRSCEMICDEIHDILATEYGYNRTYKISVSEDGENGAEKKYKKVKK